MLVLGLDTSSAATSVAVGRRSSAQDRDDLGSVEVLHETSEVATNRHGELLAPLIDAGLRRVNATAAEIGTIVVGVGPGPFTGLRVGLVTAVAMGAALGVDVVGICSLDAVAFGGDRDWSGGFAVMSDARRREVYWAAYREAQRLTPPAVSRPAQIGDLPPTVVGAGALLHREALPADVAVDDRAPYPSASALLRLASEPQWHLPPRPLYLRRPDAVPPGRLKSVTPA